jgi:hypothetical protein
MYLKEKVEQKSDICIYIYIYIYEFKKGCQPIIALITDENDNLFLDFHNLSRRVNGFSQKAKFS